MNEFNLNRIGLPSVRDLGNGVTASVGGACPSRVFGCHLFQHNLRYGFLYKNGSNTRIAYLRNNAVRFGTISREQCILMFTEVQTNHGVIGNVQPADFNQPWFDAAAQAVVREQLEALEMLADERNELIDMLKELSIDEIREVKRSADNLMNP